MSRSYTQRREVNKTLGKGKKTLGNGKKINHTLKNSSTKSTGKNTGRSTKRRSSFKYNDGPLTTIDQANKIAHHIIENSKKFVKSQKLHKEKSIQIIRLLDSLHNFEISVNGSSKRYMSGGAVNMKYALGDFISLISLLCSIACMIAIYHDTRQLFNYVFESSDAEFSINSDAYQSAVNEVCSGDNSSYACGTCMEHAAVMLMMVKYYIKMLLTRSLSIRRLVEAILSKLSIEGIQIGTEALLSFEENARRVCGGGSIIGIFAQSLLDRISGQDITARCIGSMTQIGYDNYTNAVDSRRKELTAILDTSSGRILRNIQIVLVTFSWSINHIRYRINVRRRFKAQQLENFRPRQSLVTQSRSQPLSFSQTPQSNPSFSQPTPMLESPYSPSTENRTTTRPGRRRVPENTMNFFQPRTLNEYQARTVTQLKEICRARGLIISGKKDEIIQRLMDYNQG